MAPGLPDPAALPAAAGLLRALVVLLFALHALAVSLAIGGGLAALAAGLRRDEPFQRAAARLARSLSLVTAVAATLGAGALPFLVALHGREALPAAVVMAWPWVSIALLLAFAAWGFRRQARLTGARPRSALGAGALATGALLLVAWLFAVHASLLAAPHRHLDLWLAEPRGLTLPLTLPTLWPRWLHLVVGSAAVGALWLLLDGARQGGEAGGRLVGTAAGWLVAALVAEVPLGGWALAALPDPGRAALLGGDLLATGSLALGALMTLSAVPIALKARRGGQPGRRAAALVGHLAAILVLMAVVRDGARQALLQAARTTSPVVMAPAVETDVAGLVVFAIALLVAALALVWLLRAWRRAAPAA